MNKLKSWFHGLSLTGKVATVATALILSFGVIGAAAQPGSDTITNIPATAPAPVVKTVQKTPKVEVRALSTTEAIPFTSSTVDDSSLDQGTIQTRTKGVDGLLTHTYQVTYTDGVETSRSEPVDTVTTAAINEVIVHGTKAPAPVCSNGTYVNSAGNTVCSPYSSQSAPAGASAQCSDGTYSFSQSRRGTCSHHGGVATWL